MIAESQNDTSPLGRSQQLLPRALNVLDVDKLLDCCRSGSRCPQTRFLHGFSKFFVVYKFSCCGHNAEQGGFCEVCRRLGLRHFDTSALDGDVFAFRHLTEGFLCVFFFLVRNRPVRFPAFVYDDFSCRAEQHRTGRCVNLSENYRAVQNLRFTKGGKHAPGDQIENLPFCLRKRSEVNLPGNWKEAVVVGYFSVVD